MTFRILILGGTTEARELAGRLRERPDLALILSLAGRTANPVPQPVPVRTGGFGGVDGLAAYLSGNGIDLLIDATHPFAERISAHALAASGRTGIPLLTLRRDAWQRVAGDRWVEAGDIAAAVAALGKPPRRVFVALGRQELRPLETAPQHFYLIRSVDPVEPRPALPNADFLLDRGPFVHDDEVALLESNRIDAVLCKNSGGDAAYAKISAARALAIPVVLVDRPPAIGSVPLGTVAEMVMAVDHLLPPAEKRGE